MLSLRRTFVSVFVSCCFVPLAVGEAPTLELPEQISVPFGSPVHVALDAFDADGDELEFDVSISDPSLLEYLIPEGNRSLELTVANFGQMTFELFEGRANRATDRIIELTEAGFYENLIFHRVIENFMIQGGDPTGTGRGASELPDFDDHFHPDLHHSSSGILSMAKSSDDTNNSQFFITDGPTSWLDFNHTVFGKLVEGDDVREAINITPTAAGDRPVEDVVIEAARIFDDVQNGVLMLKALGEATEPIDITVSVSDGTDTVFQTLQVNVTEDPVNHPPVLGEIPILETSANTTLSFQLTGFDIENDETVFEVATNGFDVSTSPDGMLTFNPPEGFVGEANFWVRIRPPFDTRNTDVQAVTVNVVPEPGSASMFILGLALFALRRRQ